MSKRQNAPKSGFQSANKKLSASNYTDKLKGGKKRDGTPEKATSPNLSQSQVEEEQAPPPKQVIDGEDIQALLINKDKLRDLHVPKPPSAERKRTPTKPALVRKAKPRSEIEKPKTRRITIAKPAPPDAPLKQPEYLGGTGPRFDAHGNVIPYTILGTVEEFKMEAIRQGHLQDYPEQKEVDLRPRTPSVKYEKKRTSAVPPQNPLLDENNALKNWQQKMIDRKRQQGYISKLLQKPVEHLVMNQAEDYRKIQEERYLIDRSIPAVDYGKGYRVGSEFWKQVEKIGDDITGIQMTLTQTERGYPPPVEHIGNPKVVQQEKGTTWQAGRSTPINYPWKKSQYLHQRKQQIQEVMEELDPYKPDLDNLQIVGSNKPLRFDEEAERESLQDATITEMPEEEDAQDPLRDQPDIPQPVIGPALLFDGYPARWTGDSYAAKGEIGHVARVTFEAFAGERVTSHLQLVNDGTTTIYYDWKLIPKSNPLETVLSGNVQRFYFNTSSGVLLPGDGLKFPFVFKSPNAGIFSETWQLVTRPALNGGCALQVTLRAVALQEDKNLKLRNEIERELSHKQAEMNIRKIVDDLVEGIRTPDRARSPVDAYITEEEIFERLNPGMHFTNEIVSELRSLYMEQFDEEERDGKEWDLSLGNMKDAFLEIEDEEKREDLLMRMNTAVVALRFPPMSPVQQQMYKVAYQCWLESVDGLVGQSMFLRSNLGMDEKEDVYPETETRKRYHDRRIQSGKRSVDSAAGKSSQKSEPKKKKKEPKEEEPSKKDKKDGGKKGKKDEKEKDRPKSKSKGGKQSRTAPTPTQSSSIKDLTTPSGERQDLRSPQLLAGAITPASETGDPVLDNKYRTKLYVQVYGLLGDMVEKMVSLFEEIKSYEEEKALSQTK
ncbi:MYCBP-associated protein-like [Ptychodera flava]|uniref:MYCBP-associated protein-like n=1 Tax=Ptychodera flava TaxID=63121 RepID=UPI00396AA784